MLTIYFYIVFFITAIFKIPKLYRLKKQKNKMEKTAYEDKINSIARNWAYILLKKTKSNIQVIGEENVPKDGAVLFVGNHQSNFDIPLYLSCIKKNKGFISKIEIKKIPIIKNYMYELNCIFINRNDMKQSAKSILDGIKILKNGYSLVVFPEGTRSKSHSMGKFKNASFKLALKSKVPIIPVTVNGSYKIMEGNKNNKIKPADVILTIHKPVYTDTLTDDEVKDLPNNIYNIINSAL